MILIVLCNKLVPSFFAIEKWQAFEKALSWFEVTGRDSTVKIFAAAHYQCYKKSHFQATANKWTKIMKICKNKTFLLYNIYIYI